MSTDSGNKGEPTSTRSEASYSHTADYAYLEYALQSRWSTCEGLAHELRTFVPKGIEEFEADRESELQRLRLLNPDSDIESLTVAAESQIASRAAPEIQHHLRFTKRFMTEYVLVTILAHALCEAAINTLLAIGLARADKEELFALLERAEVKEKWRIGPQAFSPSYRLDKGRALYQTLTYLTRQRNALVHYKIDLEMQGQKVLTGSGFKRKSMVEEAGWLERFFNLPYDLVDSARWAIPEHPILILVDRGPIRPVAAHAGS